MSTHDAPELELIVESISKNAALGSSAAVESSGELRGYLRISRREALVLRDISIYFEGEYSKPRERRLIYHTGVSRNWIATKSSVQLYIPMFKAERKVSVAIFSPFELMLMPQSSSAKLKIPHQQI
jgi:hypothetical protein